AASGERSREILVADDYGALECSVPENMIGVGVGINDVPNRLRRHCADRCKEAEPFTQASPAVNHSDSVAADYESDIGDCTLVLRCHHSNGTNVGINTRRDLSAVSPGRAAGMTPRSVASNVKRAVAFHRLTD